MTWFKLDDSTYDHPKLVQLSDAAFRLWIRAGTYSARYLTDGLVTQSTLRVLQAKSKHCDELWTAGLWERVTDGGYRFHDWHDYQPTRESVLAAREAERDRKAKWREAKRLKQIRSADEAPLEEEW